VLRDRADPVRDDAPDLDDTDAGPGTLGGAVPFADDAGAQCRRPGPDDRARIAPRLARARSGSGG
jgi:hypothetical protein